MDGSLSYRKSCRMAVCGSCGMRMDGGAVLACKTPMLPLVEAGEVPVISPMGNLPVIKDLVVDMDAVLGEVPRHQALPGRRRRRGARQGVAGAAGGARPDHEGGALHPVRLLRLGVQLDGGPTPTSWARRRWPRPPGSSTTSATAAASARLELVNGEHGVWDCTRCYFCQERCPKGVDPRDAIAKVGARIYQEGMHGDKGARHAKVFVMSAHKTGYLLETNLVPETIGPMAAIKEITVRPAAGPCRQGAEPAEAAQGEEARRGSQAGQADRRPGEGRAGARHRRAVGRVKD